MSHTIVVVPCYNEEDRLDLDCFSGFIEQWDGIDLLFVNDGSTDSTLSRLIGLQDRYSNRISILDLSTNQGKAEAVRHGLLDALWRRPDFIGFWDADLATPLEEIPRFRDILNERDDCELVIGSRVVLLGRRIERTWMRHLLGRAFATCVSAVLGLPVYDTQCGAKMLRASTKWYGVLSEPFQSRWIFDVEIIARMIRQGLCDRVSTEDSPILEHPLMEWRDVAGSKLKGRDFIKATWELANIYRTYMYGQPPGFQLVAKPDVSQELVIGHEERRAA